MKKRIFFSIFSKKCGARPKFQIHFKFVYDLCSTKIRDRIFDTNEKQLKVVKIIWLI